MVTGKQIKIIKRAERHTTQAALADESRASPDGSVVIARSDAVTIVTGWVRELRQKKVAEATRGFESLFQEAV
ncbi:MAG: hypothetical protein AUG51_03085 [Acidobacteria bacterium 13_1_20CM_3_53_8]|nr:MAG: hypothetical protein AUG51_03085 [Acidobacteria bacterium 13_1_20CM_3_53_8]